MSSDSTFFSNVIDSDVNYSGCVLEDGGCSTILSDGEYVTVGGHDFNLDCEIYQVDGIVAEAKAKGTVEGSSPSLIMYISIDSGQTFSDGKETGEFTEYPDHSIETAGAQDDDWGEDLSDFPSGIALKAVANTDINEGGMYVDYVKMYVYYTCEEEGSYYSKFITLVGSPTSWVWNSGQFNVDSGIRATSDEPTNWKWGVISSSSNYFYPSGNPTSWAWVSGSYNI